MGKLLPLILAIVGLGVGAGAGIFLKPAEDMEASIDECVAAGGDAHAEPELDSHGDPIAAEPELDSHGNPIEADAGHATDCEPKTDHAAAPAADAGGHGDTPVGLQYAKLANQFVIPVVKDGKVASLVVMSLSVEVDAASLDTVYEVEPKLRDAFLSSMFLHANTGGFDGDFTRGQPMDDLRASLRKAGIDVMGATVHDVLITEIIRQDI